MLDLHVETEFLGYCFEVGDGGTQHTHMLLQSREPQTKASLIRELSMYLEIPCQLQVDVHKNFGTIIGYHIGFGDKARCENLVVCFPYDFIVEDYIKKKVGHKARGLKEQAAQNKIILEKTTKEAALEGLITWKDFDKHARAKNQWDKWFKEDERDDIPEVLPPFHGNQIIWDADVKKTHHWIWSKASDRGKTTWARSLYEQYKYVWKDDFTWWNDLDDERIQGVILDDYESKLDGAKLKRLCDGAVDLNSKFGNVTKLDRRLHIIILSNYPISYCYPKHAENLYSRFNEINCD